MNLKLLAYLPLVLIANTASGQSLYLTCKATTFPEMDFKKIYKSLPPNPREQFIEDMIVEGLVGILLNKAESWEIKITEKTVTSPEENSGPKFSNATITEAKVTAAATSPNGKNNFWYELNRITGKLTYRIYLAEDETKTWRSKHGGQLPQLWKWEQSCTSSSRPKI